MFLDSGWVLGGAFTLLISGSPWNLGFITRLTPITLLNYINVTHGLPTVHWFILVYTEVTLDLNIFFTAVDENNQSIVKLSNMHCVHTASNTGIQSSLCKHRSFTAPRFSDTIYPKCQMANIQYYQCTKSNLTMSLTCSFNKHLSHRICVRKTQRTLSKRPESCTSLVTFYFPHVLSIDVSPTYRDCRHCPIFHFVVATFPNYTSDSQTSQTPINIAGGSILSQGFN